MKKVIAILSTAIVVLNGFTACSPPDKMESFAQAVELIQDYNSTQGTNDATDRQKQNKIDNTLKQLGLVESAEDDTNASGIDQDFISEYLQTNSIEDFLANYYLIQQYCIHNWYHSFSGICFCEQLSSSVNNLAAVCEEQIITFDSNNMNGPGYYTEHPDAEPQPETSEVAGTFYNRSGTDRHTETKTNETTVEYYGDFAIVKEKVYFYDEGRYEWSNGVFYDELPSWDLNYYSSLWFRGFEIYDGIDDLDNLKIIESVPNAIYWTIAETTPYSSNHTYFLVSQLNQ